MTNVKRKSLVYALILTLCLGVIPFNVVSFQAAAETKSKAPAVTAKTYSKKAGRYTVKVKQAKVDYKTVNVYVPGVKTLKKVKGKKKVYKIKATAYMYCDKKVSKKKSKTVKLSSISSKKKYFTMAAPAMGKYNFVVKYYNKKGKKTEDCYSEECRRNRTGIQYRSAECDLRTVAVLPVPVGYHEA